MKNRSKNNYSNSNKTELTIFSIIRGRSSHRRYSIAKAILKNFAQNSRENTCVTASFLIKLQACLWHRCFPVNFGKILRTTFLQNTSLAVASMKNTIYPPVKLKQLSVIFILKTRQIFYQILARKLILVLLDFCSRLHYLLSSDSKAMTLLIVSLRLISLFKTFNKKKLNQSFTYCVKNSKGCSTIQALPSAEAVELRCSVTKAVFRNVKFLRILFLTEHI